MSLYAFNYLLTPSQQSEYKTISINAGISTYLKSFTDNYTAWALDSLGALDFAANLALSREKNPATLLNEFMISALFADWAMNTIRTFFVGSGAVVTTSDIPFTLDSSKFNIGPAQSPLFQFSISNGNLTGVLTSKPYSANGIFTTPQPMPSVFNDNQPVYFSVKNLADSA